MIARSLTASCLLCLAIANSAHAESGIASVYCHGGGRTASGEPPNPDAMTAAHRTLPFGTRVTVTNATQRALTLRINDRGPFVAVASLISRQRRHVRLASLASRQSPSCDSSEYQNSASAKPNAGRTPSDDLCIRTPAPQLCYARGQRTTAWFAPQYQTGCIDVRFFVDPS